MGCTVSKLDNEDTVRRCKDRCHLAKEAVQARHHLAAAHADYCRFLRLTGTTLSAFAAGEPLNVSSRTPPVILRSPSSLSHSSSFRPPTIPSRSPSSRSLHAPPPPPPFAPSPSPTKLPHILTDSSHPRRSRPPKLPHILSESSPSSSPVINSKYNYPVTPSQASSVWNWENFRPPSPPDSDYFDRLESNSIHQNSNPLNDYDFFHPSDDGARSQNRDSKTLSHPIQRNHDHHLDADDEAEREEVQCSDWGDRYSSTTSSQEDDQNGSDAERHSCVGSAVRKQVTPFSKPRKNTNSAKNEDAQSSASWNSQRDEGSDMKIVVRHKNLKEIVDAIKEYFDKAATEGEKMSDILETGRAQLDRSFTQLRKTLYHSSNLFSNLSSSWSSKPPLAVKYRLDPAEYGETKSLCSALERLWTWEKKLYEEVKARESARIELEKKLATLQSQEYKGEDEAKLNKTKASIKKLQSIIVVTSQAVNTTSTAIIGLKDKDLVPQLVGLCHGLLYMWKSMSECHELQSVIVQQVQGLVNQVVKGESTTDMHRQITRDLESAVSAWHSSFCRLIKFQRDFIRALHGWLKLSLISVDSETSISHSEPSEVFSFLDEWKLALDRIPDPVASEAIKSFVNVIHVIVVKQTEELKMKKRAENAAKELEKKASNVRSIERKFYNSYSTVGLGLPDSGPGSGVIDARDPLAEKKAELAVYQRRVEDELLRHSKAVEVTRAMTLNNIQTGLPGVFQAVSSFSGLFVDAMQAVSISSYSISM